jgi:hypothetical protein
VWLTHGFADVAVSVYDDADFSADGARYTHRFTGGKFPGVMAFLEAHPNVIDDYDYFWLFEDDLVLPFDSLRVISNTLGRIPFALSAPGLSRDSYFTWPMSIANDRFEFRCTDFVEVMAPIMSRDFLRAAMPAFNDNFSAWGHEWLWRKLLSEQRTAAAIFDSAPITHARPFGRGPLLKSRPAGSLDPAQDLEIMLAKYGLDRSVPFRTVFGVTREDPPRLLAGEALRTEALLGYEDMRDLPNENHQRCIDGVVAESRSTPDPTDHNRLPIYRMVKAALDSVVAPSPLPATPDKMEPVLNSIPLRETLIGKIWRGVDPWATPPARHTPHFQGWGSSHHYLGEAIVTAAKTGGSVLALEVGVWKGGSVITMAQQMRDLGVDGVVIAVDTWLGAWDHWTMDEWFPELRLEGGLPGLYDVFRSNVIERNLQQYILPLPLDSVNAAHVLKHFEIYPEVLHIDGGHDFTAVTGDLRSWWPLLAEGGTLIGDDYHMGGVVWPGVQQAFDTFFHEVPLENVEGKCRLTKQPDTLAD